MPGIGRRKKGYWIKPNKVDEPLDCERYPDAPFMWTRTLEDHHVVLPPNSRAVTTHYLVVTENGTWSLTLHSLDLDPSKCPPLNGLPTVPNSDVNLQ